MKVTLKIDGNKLAVKAIEQAKKEFVEFLEDEVTITTDNIVTKAVSRVRVDLGILKGGIYKEQQGINAEVGDRIKYAPYVEFGTGGLVNVPKGLEDYAIQFKGKGIKQVNLPPRPFLFNSAFEEVQAMIKRVDKATNINGNK